MTQLKIAFILKSQNFILMLFLQLFDERYWRLMNLEMILCLLEKVEEI